MIRKDKALLPIIGGTVLAAVVALSVFLYLRDDSRWHRYVLFFPKYTDPAQIEGEIRKIRHHDDQETNLKRVIHELMVGPGDVRLLRIMPANGEVNTVLYRDGTAYIDFSAAILFSEDVSPLTLEERLDLLSKSLYWNFPEIKSINYTINGEVPVDIIIHLTENRGEVKKK